MNVYQRSYREMYSVTLDIANIFQMFSFTFMHYILLQIPILVDVYSYNLCWGDWQQIQSMVVAPLHCGVFSNMHRGSMAFCFCNVELKNIGPFHSPFYDNYYCIWCSCFYPESYEVCLQLGNRMKHRFYTSFLSLHETVTILVHAFLWR